MNTSDINQILTEKETYCISIVVATPQHTRDRIQNPKTIRRVVNRAKTLLNQSTWPGTIAKELDKRLDSILEKIDYIRLQEGLAIFISPNTLKIIQLPFSVEEKISLGDHFEVRDLLYYAQFLTTYYLLTVSKKRIRLLKGQGHNIHEISNDDFPKQFIDDYEYAHPSVGSSSSTGLKEFERDKSILKAIRQEAFIKHVDAGIDKYIKKGTPLIIAGVEEEVSTFEHVTSHLNNVIGKISGNYDVDALHPLSEVAWEKINNHIKATQKDTLKMLREGIGKRLTAVGIQEVWKAAMEGNCLTLVIEKDYRQSVYQHATNPSQIFVTSPSANFKVIIDATDSVIKMVRERGGNVIIVENNELHDYNCIAMLRRYPDQFTGY